MTADNISDRAAKQEGQLLALFTALGYGLFTLLPDSHSLMVAWPWVFIWQVTLILPILWFLQNLAYQRRIQLLGNGFDGVILLLLLGLGISGTFSEFPNQARWFGWAAVGGCAALYALNAWLRKRDRQQQLLQWLGYFTIVFIIWSLFLWLKDTIFPEYLRIQELSTQGFNIGLNHQNLEFRNWAPMGHQNYVAGFLLLSLPLLGALAWQGGNGDRWWRTRWFWLGGLGLGFVDLYSTNSRGGWLGLITILVIITPTIWQQWRQRSPWGQHWFFHPWIMGTGITLVMALFLFFTNSRLRRSLLALGKGYEGTELAYRWITSEAGWLMGWDHPLTGHGLGTVPLVYQRYRPVWAGREAELVFQLHNTPMQIWAELGLWGVASLLLLVGLLFYWLFQRHRWLDSLDGGDRPWVLALYAAFGGYAVLSVTDYQLDNISISGILIFELALLTTFIRTGLGQSPPPRTRFRYALTTVGIGLGIVLAIVLWLIPIQRAWQLSSQGFLALLEETPNWEQFTKKLTAAQELAPWEPYYPFQLGWNLGNRGLRGTETDRENQQSLMTQAIAEFNQGNRISPDQEFGHSNVAWLYLRTEPQGALYPFGRASQLVPAKRGNFLGLGLTLLYLNQESLGTEALTLEALRDPSFITSPLWRDPLLTPLYPRVLEALSDRYQALQTEFPVTNTTGRYARQVDAVLLWWKKDYAGAMAVLKDLPPQFQSAILQDLIEFEQKDFQAPTVPDLQDLRPDQLFLLAWGSAQNRPRLLQTAWSKATQETLPAHQMKDLLDSISDAEDPATRTDFDTWLRFKSPAVAVTFQRAGFGVLSRHIDGPQPVDFFVSNQNLVLSALFQDLWPSNIFLPDLDKSLEPDRQHLLTQLNLGLN
ncbi:O-antigen ligase family protein [Candidatus Synechococcus calcipolaris G9]|uniref:O-antigen ligase family protein n=1 Tax=Candidatus Synechococcus calcipolaris G9 TaxID=1497997 RepID=A0ABT6EZG5_9SYNE|nr:O-antigen ligase family protein [Candidatus Synechococcus calcipolaris]MDG2990967.1 O-antigen ligase family protein [Candidatus Synechococcus calcipolaris G9]